MKKYTFRKWLKRWLNRDDEIESEAGLLVAKNPVRSPRHRGAIGVVDDALGTEPLRLNIYNASGGFIVETRTYNSQKDQTITNLYIVNNSELLGEEISKIITLTSLSR